MKRGSRKQEVAGSVCYAAVGRSTAIVSSGLKDTSVEIVRLYV